MMRLETPLPQIIKSLSNKRPQPVKLKDGVSLNVVIAARGYPEQPESGFSLPHIDQTPAEIQIFHSGTKWLNSEWVATGGRLFSVNTFQDSLLNCQQSIYPWIENLAFQEKITYRRDIGVRAYRHLIEINDYA
jgi:phosphoribosylamine--glycine ligase